MCDDGICLSTLATGSIVDNISNVFVDSERLSSHGRLINGEQSIARAVLLSNLIVVTVVFNFLAGLSLELLLELGPAVGVVVGGDNSGVSRDNLSVFNNDLSAPINFLLIDISPKNLQCHREPVRGP